MKTLKRTFSVLLILAVFLLALPLSPAVHAAQPLPSSVSVDLQDADFGSYNTSYTNSSVGAFNPLITNTGKESLQVSSYYMKISLISGDTDAFTVGWNAGTGTCRPGYKCSKGYIRVNNGLSAGTYTATLAFSYDYDGTGSDYDWIIVKTSTVSITITPSQTCVVSFDKNGGVDNYSNHGVVKNSVYTLPNCIIMPPSGKTFDQWEVTVGSNAAVRKNPGDSVTITDDTTVKALWKEKVLAAELENVYLNNATSKIAYEGYSAMDYRMLFGISITGTETLNCDEDHLKIELTGEDADAFNIWVSHSSYDAPGNSYNAGTLYPAYGLTAGSYTANLKLSYDEDGLGTTYAWKVLDDTKTVSFTVYELTQIDSAAVTITPPSVGANPDYNAGLPDDALYHLELNDLNTIVNSVSWFDQTAEKWIEPTDSFEAGHIYNVRIDLHPDEGASFSSDCIATVNGNPAEVRLRELEEETYLRVEYTFPQLVSETPEKPVITDVSNVSNGVKISWNAVPGAAKYAVYRKGPNDTAFKKLATTAELSFTNRSVASGKTYRYSVRAVTSDGIMSGYSAGKSILYLRIPVIQSIENVSTGVKLAWDAVGGAAKYYIYRKGPGETSFTKLVATTELSYTNKSVVSGKEYRYSVRAVTADGTTLSAYSAGQSIKFMKAPVFTLENVSTGVKLSWSAVGGASKYYIYRKAPGETGFTKLVATSDLTYTNRSVTAGKEYRYAIRAAASDSASKSASSAPSALIRLTAPASVTGYSTSGKNLIVWKGSPEASAYVVYRRDIEETVFTKISTVSGVTFSDENVSAGKKYRYSVRTIGNDGKSLSAFSAGVTIQCTQDDSLELKVPFVCQYPELPTGCEPAAATAVLQYWGENITASEFARSWLECSSSFYSKDGIIYGPDPNQVFAGDPFSYNSYGCLAPPIADAINKNSALCKAEILYQSTLEKLYDQYVSEGKPVLIWATVGMRPVLPGGSWRLEDGRSYVWPLREHCLALVGQRGNSYLFEDPDVGKIVAYSKEEAQVRFVELGSQAIIVTPKY